MPPRLTHEILFTDTRVWTISVVVAFVAAFVDAILPVLFFLRLFGSNQMNTPSRGICFVVRI